MDSASKPTNQTIVLKSESTFIPFDQNSDYESNDN